MNKINLKDLKETIKSNDKYIDLIVDEDIDDDNQNYLSLRCFCRVYDESEEFASVYENGILDMKFGTVDVIYIMNIKYHDEETGEVLPEYDNYETLFELIVESIRDDIEDNRAFLEDIEESLGLM